MTTNVADVSTAPLSEMEQLLQGGSFKNPPKVGEIIEGTVLSVSKKEVLIDIPGVTTGVVRGPELVDESGEYENLEVGSTVAATIMTLDNERGEIECSFRTAGLQRAWNTAKALLASGAIVSVKVLSANKGGLMVSVNRLQGFLPVSQLTPEHYPRVTGGDKQKILEKLQPLIGQDIEVKIIDANDQEEKLIVSEKKAFEEKQRATISAYQTGAVVEGTVSGITNFGAFVRFDQNLEGLIHISELSWQRVEDPSTILSVGQKVRTKIIGIDGSKISLSLKRLEEDPWKKAIERYHVGQRVRGVVKKLNPYGLFVELDENIQGLAHISQLNIARSMDLPSVAKIGEEMDFIIVSIDPEHHRLGLSRKLIDAPSEALAKEDEPTTASAATDAPAETLFEAPKPVAEVAPELPTEQA